MIAYLDNAATTRATHTVIDKVNQIMTECYGNPSSLHTMGIEAEREVLAARRKVADMLGKDFKEIYFTSGGTESNNIAIFGTLPRGGHVITTKIEHKSVLEPLKKFEVDLVNVNRDGVVDLDHFESLLRDDTKLVSIMHVNNEVGTIQPIREIAELLRGRNTLYHVDAVQSFCKFDTRLPADLISMSGHKIGGLKGAGALYVRSGVNIKPLTIGGGQEKGLRSGTENVPGIAALGAACQMMNYDYVAKLKAEMLRLLPSEATIISPYNASPYVLSIAFKGIRSEILLHSLERHGVYVSSGSACGLNQPSHVVTAMGHPREIVDGVIRISFAPWNTMEEVEYAAVKIREEICKLY